MADGPARNPRKLSPLGPVAPLEDRVVPAAAWALLPNNSLAPFSTDNPAAALAPVPVVGLTTGEALVGIDVRPQNGMLYGLAYSASASTVRLYAISPRNGFATPLTTAGVQFSNIAGAVTTPVPITGTAFGIDFNPVVDRLRVTTDTGLNFRMNPNTGALVDSNTNPADGVQPDTNVSGGTTVVDATAYTNNVQNATATTQYTLDATTNTLFIQGAAAPGPNGGVQSNPLPVTAGGAALDFTGASGFDIPAGVNVATGGLAATGRAFAALTAAGGTQLYGIELSTGVATALGTLPAGAVGLAVNNDYGGLPSVALTNTNGLVRFNTATPGTRVFATLTGVAANEQLVGLDYRPATGQLFALGVDAAGGATANTATLYRIDAQSNGATTPAAATATAIGAAFTLADAAGVAIALPTPAAAGYGFDFNPTVDRIRVTTSTGLNFRLNPLTGQPVDTNTTAAGNQPDAPISGGPAGVSATAYTNSFGRDLTAAAGPTTQYTIDTTTDTLFIQGAVNPPGPNGGVQSNPLTLSLTAGGAAIDFDQINGFDIPAGVSVVTSGTPAAGRGYALLRLAGGTDSTLYAIDLTTGVATPATTPVGGVVTYPGLAVGDAPAGEIQFAAASTTVTEAAGSVTLTLTRTGGTVGAVTVSVAELVGVVPVTGFGAIPPSVTFADGQTSATLTIPVTNNADDNPDQTLLVRLSAPTNGAVLGAQALTAVTATDDDPAPPAGTIQFGGSTTYTVIEGGATALTLTRTGGTAGEVSVTVTVTTGTAGAADFTALPATVTFAAGSAVSTPLLLEATDDALVEGDETLTVTLSAPTGGAVLGTQTMAMVTITDDDMTAPPPGSVGFSAATYTVNESAGTVTVTLTRTGGTAGAFTVAIGATGGTATATADFGAIATPVSFADGQTTATVTIPISNDALVEGAETINLTLTDPTGGVSLASQATAVVTIADDDAAAFGAVRFAGSTVSVSEGAGTVTITLVRGDASTAAFTVSLTVSGGTATSGADFGAVATSVAFAQNQNTATVTIPITNDTSAEGPETILLALVAPAGVTLGSPSTTSVTVLDNDTAVPPGRPFLVSGQPDGTARVLNGNATTAAFGSTVTFPGLTGVVRVAVADVNGDGTADYVGGAGPGGASRVVILNGLTGATLASFDVFESTFTGGVFVAAADLDGDGKAEVVVTPDQGGGPLVAVYRGSALTSGAGANSQIIRLFGIEDPNFRGGARPALGDVTGDGRADLVVSAGFLGGPRVALFDGASLSTGATPVKLVADFFAFEDTLRNGAFVALGDLTGDGRAELIFGGGPGGGPRVRAFNGAGLLGSPAFTDLDDAPASTQVANFFAGDTATRGGVRLAAHDLDGDGRAELVAGSGEGQATRVRLYRPATLLANGSSPTAELDVDPFATTLANGVFVG